MAEQKVLLKRAKDGSKEEKMAILARLKELSKEMEGLDKPKTSEENVVMSDKERLDKELEKHGMETNDQDELMRLSAQLSALRDKVGSSSVAAIRASSSPSAELKVLLGEYTRYSSIRSGEI